MPRGKPIANSARQNAQCVVNEINEALDRLIQHVETAPGAFQAPDLGVIEGFLTHRTATALQRMRLLIARDVRGSGSFDFDMNVSAPMPLAAPQSAMQRHPFTQAPAARTPSQGGTLAPVGRLVGSHEKVFGENEAASPTPSPVAEPDDIDFIDN